MINERILEKIKAAQSSAVLDLLGNDLTLLPKEVTELAHLTRLYLSSNRLTALPKEISALTFLSRLYLSGNQLTALPEEMVALKHLTHLDLGRNRFSAFPKEIAAFTDLTQLFLSVNQLTALPKEIAALTQLKSLHLGDNRLTSLPKEIAALKGLSILDLGDNQLAALPEEIVALNQLSELDLSHNQLTVFPKEIIALTGLTKLDLRDNQLTTLPKEMTALTQLTALDLSGNQLTQIPKEILKLPKLKHIDVTGNQLQLPPQRVADEGMAAIRRWFEEETVSGTVENYESKVLLLGSPNVGKTSLRKKIEDVGYLLNPKESRTVGVEIYHWEFDLSDGEKTAPAIAHLFDFGGQEIQYMAHQFFLSPMAFHILMINHENNDSVIAYWLDSIRSINDRPVILPIYNEFDQQPYAGHCKAFDTLQTLPSLSINLNASNPIILQGDIEKIKARIGQHILDCKETVLTHWQVIRQMLGQLPDPYISIEQYRALCDQKGLTNIDSQNDLLLDLNKLGHVLYFKNASSKVFLQPNWLIKALYTLFKPENNLITDACFWREDLIQAWSIADKEIDRPAYTGDEQDMLFNLLLRGRFNICFQPDANEERYLVPQYLPNQARREVWEQRMEVETGLLERIHYAYSFLPLGFMAHLVVLLHHCIAKTKTGLCIWQHGVVLELNKAVAIVEQRDTGPYGKHIAIEIAGPAKHQSELHTLIIGDINKLKQLQYYFYDLKAYRPCAGCLQGSTKGYRFKLNDDTIQCPECGHKKATQKGSITMNNITITASNGSTIIAPVTIGSTIQGSLKVIQESNATETIKAEVETLLTQIAAMSGEVDEGIAKALADESKSLSEELARDEPRKQYLNLSLDGIVEAAKKVGQAAEPILSTAAKIGELFA